MAPSVRNQSASPWVAKGRGVIRKVQEALRIYRHQGLPSLVGAARTFSRRQFLKRWQLAGAEIYDECSRRIRVQTAETKRIRYDGQFRDALPPIFADVEGVIETPERIIGEYEGAYVVFPGMIVVIGRRYIVPEEVGSEQEYSPHLADNVSVSDVADMYFGGGRSKRHIASGYLLTGERGLPFAHWFYETLPKLRWYERYKALSERNPPLLVPTGMTDWQRDSLALMGYSEDSWVEIDERGMRVETLALPPHPFRNRGSKFTGSPSNLRWVRDRILSNVPERDHDFPDRIYVSRDDAVRRQIRNESDLVASLGELGFEKCILSELSLEDQVRLFADADIVVGPHGAGLTNLIYSTDVDVVELLTEKGASEHFFVLSNELDHSYEFVLCEPVIQDTVPPRHRDMIADPSRVREVVETL